MQKFIYLFLVTVLASCASVKPTQVAITPVGEWDYAITGTPNGDYSGVLVITEKETVLSAVMKTTQGELALNTISFDKTENIVTGTFNFQGMNLDLRANITGEKMDGTISTSGYAFPFNATRKIKS